MTDTLLKFAIGMMIVIAFVLAVTLAQGIGESVGHGLREWMVR